MYHRGFTILEVIIVIALGILLVALTLPIGLSFYRENIRDDAADEVSLLLKGAARDARLGKDRSPHGVAFFPGRVIGYVGTSYATRDAMKDITYELPPTLLMTYPANDILFAQRTGKPSATGTIVFSLDQETDRITVGASGLIERQ